MQDVTIIICTFNRAMSLDRTLSSFFSRYAHTATEVVIVDNNSTDETEQICKRYAGKGVRRLFQPVVGLSHARNFGLQNTARPIVIYIDDDVTICTNWLEKLVEPFSDSKVGVVGGELTPVWEATRPTWLIDDRIGNYSVNLKWSSRLKEVTRHEWLCEGNIAFRRQPLLDAGGFPVQLGRMGPVLLSGEGLVIDVIRNNGWKTLFQPKSVVNHHIAASRLEPQWLARRIFWQGVTQSIGEDYLLKNHVKDVVPLRTWKQFRLPETVSMWQTLLNVKPDENFEDTLDRLYDMGYMMHETKLI